MISQIKKKRKYKTNGFFGENSGAHRASGSSGTAGWSGSSFGVQRTGAA